jgi:hypothetical protein
VNHWHLALSESYITHMGKRHQPLRAAVRTMTGDDVSEASGKGPGLRKHQL